MPFEIVEKALLSIPCDAIVNPTDDLLSGSKGLDAQIHQVGGNNLRKECDEFIPLTEGEAMLTHAFGLRARYIIHTAVPQWNDRGDKWEILRNCYRNSLALATQLSFSNIAFPLIGHDTEGLSKELILQVAAEEIGSYLEDNDDVDITLAVEDRRDFQPNPSLMAEVEEYIRTIQEAEEKARRQELMLDQASTGPFPAITPEKIEEERRKADSFQHHPQTQVNYSSAFGVPDLSGHHKDYEKETVFSQDSGHYSDSSDHGSLLDTDVIFNSLFPEGTDWILDESFSQMVLRKIDEKGFKKDSDCYRRANIDRRLFSRIRSDRNYHPKKTTALALAVALRLSLDETNELLLKAGYSLSDSILFDIIVKCCISQGVYSVFKINEILFKHDQPLLGG